MNHVRTCIYNFCPERAVFGYPGGSATHCMNHRMSDMRDIKHKQCTVNNCAKYARYIDGQNFYCYEHRTENAVNTNAH
jgi:hypothetical protein